MGEWLPEPLVTDASDDPARHAEMADSLSLAFLVLLESLSPEQRAAFLLHDVFGYGYGEIAEIVGKSEDNARQLAARARRHVDDGGRASRLRARSATSWPGGSSRPRGRASSTRSRQLLAEDVVLHGDGGGKVPALAAPCTARGAWPGRWPPGPSRAPGSPALTFRLVEVNGQPGAHRPWTATATSST